MLGGCKTCWGCTNEVGGVRTPPPPPPPPPPPENPPVIKSCFKIDGALVEDQREIANRFNTFFSSIARNINAKLCSSRPVYHIDSGNKKITDYLGNRISSSMFLFDCSSNEIHTIIKASDISISVLKKCAPFISEHSFMRLGLFPQKLKFGKFSLIFKKGDVQLFDNYRPISVLPIFGKIFEQDNI